MADEYINKTELLFEMATSLIPQSMDITRGYAIAKDLIRNAPVADVAPVVHGEWVPIVNYFHGKPDGRYYCSVCHRVETMKGIYCRLCGALMDGGSKNV
jgi:hypothetical protein